MEWTGRADWLGLRRPRRSGWSRLQWCRRCGTRLVHWNRRRTPSLAVAGDASGCPNDGIGDVVDRWILISRRWSRTDSCGGRAPRVWPVRFRSAAHDHIARKQAFVLASSPLGLNRIFRCGRSRFLVGRSHRRGSRRGRLRFLSGSRFEHSQPILIVTHSLRCRRLNRRGGADGASSRFRPARYQDDEQDADCKSHHEPRLRSSRKDATGNRAMIRHRCCAWRSRSLGHSAYRPCCENETRSFPSAR